MSEPTPICARCGAAVDAGHDFCPKCGNAMRLAPPRVPAGPPPLPKQSSPILPIALAAGGAILLLAAAAFFMIGKDSGSGPSATVTWNGGSPGKVEFEASQGSDGESGSSADVVRDFLQDHPLSGTFHCRKGAEFDVDPEDAVFAIDDVVIGKADDFDGSGGGKVYYFRGPGTYIARLSMKGYRTAWVKIVVSPDAAEEIVSVDTELRKR